MAATDGHHGSAAGRGNVAIDYRHVIWSLVRKPRALHATSTARRCSPRSRSGEGTTRSSSGSASGPTSSTSGSSIWLHRRARLPWKRHSESCWPR